MIQIFNYMNDSFMNAHQFYAFFSSFGGAALFSDDTPFSPKKV